MINEQNLNVFKQNDVELNRFTYLFKTTCGNFAIARLHFNYEEEYMMQIRNVNKYAAEARIRFNRHMDLRTLWSLIKYKYGILDAKYNAYTFTNEKDARAYIISLYINYYKDKCEQYKIEFNKLAEKLTPPEIEKIYEIIKSKRDNRLTDFKNGKISKMISDEYKMENLTIERLVDLSNVNIIDLITHSYGVTL